MLSALRQLSAVRNQGSASYACRTCGFALLTSGTSVVPLPGHPVVLYVDSAVHAERFPVCVQNRLHAVLPGILSVWLSAHPVKFSGFIRRQQLFLRHVEVRVCSDPVEQIVFCALFLDALCRPPWNARGSFRGAPVCLRLPLQRPS